MKSEEVKEWEAFVRRNPNTMDGIKLGLKPKDQKYLTNRIRLAFFAGQDSGQRLLKKHYMHRFRRLLD